jgi:hypothetical protein
MSYADAEYQRSVSIDILTMEKIEKKINLLYKKLRSDPSLWSGVISIGWTRMLDSSDFPVLPDRVLKEGFSPLDWFLVIKKTTYQLSKTLAQLENFKLKEKEISDILGIEFNIKEDIDKKILDHVKNILSWNKVIENLNIIEIKSLAFIWTIDCLIASSGIILPDTEAKIQKISLEILQQLLDEEDFIKRLDEAVDHLVTITKEITPTGSIEIADWSEIIRVPW